MHILIITPAGKRVAVDIDDEPAAKQETSQDKLITTEEQQEQPEQLEECPTTSKQCKQQFKRLLSFCLYKNLIENMFPLCCDFLRENLLHTCLHIGLIELVITIARTTFHMDHLVCCCCPQRIVSGCGSLAITLREISFLLHLTAAVIIIVGADKKSSNFIIGYIIISVMAELTAIGIIFTMTLAAYTFILIWTVFSIPHICFWLTAYHFIKSVKSTMPHEEESQLDTSV